MNRLEDKYYDWIQVCEALETNDHITRKLNSYTCYLTSYTKIVISMTIY